MSYNYGWGSPYPMYQTYYYPEPMYYQPMYYYPQYNWNWWGSYGGGQSIYINSGINFGGGGYWW
jgi:hypothetical protein